MVYQSQQKASCTASRQGLGFNIIIYESLAGSTRNNLDARFALQKWAHIYSDVTHRAVLCFTAHHWIWRNFISFWYLFCTVWPEPIWIKVSGDKYVPSQHQSTYLGGPELALIKIPPFRPHFIRFSKTIFYEVNLVSQCSYLELLLLSKFGSERGDFNQYRFWSS